MLLHDLHLPFSYKSNFLVPWECLIITTCIAFCQKPSWHRPYRPPSSSLSCKICEIFPLKQSLQAGRHDDGPNTKGRRCCCSYRLQRKEKWEFYTEQRSRWEGFAQMRERDVEYFAATTPFFSSWLSEFPPCDNTPFAAVHEEPATSDNVWDIPPSCSAR